MLLPERLARLLPKYDYVLGFAWSASPDCAGTAAKTSPGLRLDFGWSAAPGAPRQTTDPDYQTLNCWMTCKYIYKSHQRIVCCLGVQTCQYEWRTLFIMNPTPRFPLLLFILNPPPQFPLLLLALLAPPPQFQTTKRVVLRRLSQDAEGKLLSCEIHLPTVK